MTTPIGKIHALLTSLPATRKLQRAVVLRVKKEIGVPDAYADLSNLILRFSPAAYLDVGSHDGNTINRILEENDVKVYGFEPTSETCRRLRDRFKSDKRVSIQEIALSNQSGTTEFFCNANEQTNSLLDNDQGNQESFGDQVAHLNRQTVTIMRLDDWLSQNVPEGDIVIKSDIQGAEGLLIEGGRETLRNRVIGFYSECQIAPMYKHQADLFDLNRTLTKELGFVLANIYPCMLDARGIAIQTDALWINKRYLLDGAL